MAKKTMTDFEVEEEIARLNASPEVALARKERRLVYKRRQYMWDLQWLERRGFELKALGITEGNIASAITRTDDALHRHERED